MSAFITSLRDLIQGRRRPRPLLPVVQTQSIEQTQVSCYCWMLDAGGLQRCIPCELGVNDHHVVTIRPAHTLLLASGH